jgi:RNA polymerase sigma factor (sigma-70 family)
MTAWNRLRDSFRSHLKTAAARRDFATLRERHEPFRSFATVDDVIRALDRETDDEATYATKDDLYRLLVRAVRSGGSSSMASTATSILWLGSWSPLDRVYTQLASSFADPDDAADEIVARVTAAIRDIDLDRVRRVGAVLAQIVLHRSIEVAAREKGRRPGDIAELTDEHPSVAEDAELAWREHDPDARIDLERLLADVSPQDRDLLVRRLVLGESYDEIASDRGCRPGTLRVRVTRLVAKIRERADRV